MGLGKTLQLIAHLMSLKQAGALTQPALIVVPTSLIPNWESEIARFAPMLSVLTLHGPQRSEEHTSELPSLMRISYAVFCLKTKNNNQLHLNDPQAHITS